MDVSATGLPKSTYPQFVWPRDTEGLAWHLKVCQHLSRNCLCEADARTRCECLKLHRLCVGRGQRVYEAEECLGMWAGSQLHTGSVKLTPLGKWLKWNEPFTWPAGSPPFYRFPRKVYSPLWVSRLGNLSALCMREGVSILHWDLHTIGIANFSQAEQASLQQDFSEPLVSVTCTGIAASPKIILTKKHCLLFWWSISWGQMGHRCALWNHQK